MEGRVNETRQKGIRNGRSWNDGWTTRDETENEKDGLEIMGEERATKMEKRERTCGKRASKERTVGTSMLADHSNKLNKKQTSPNSRTNLSHALGRRREVTASSRRHYGA